MICNVPSGSFVGKSGPLTQQEFSEIVALTHAALDAGLTDPERVDSALGTHVPRWIFDLIVRARRARTAETLGALRRERDQLRARIADLRRRHR